MKTIEIRIEKTKNHFSAYAENVEGIYGGGSTFGNAKESINHAIAHLKKYNTEDNIPTILKSDYKLIFKMQA